MSTRLHAQQRSFPLFTGVRIWPTFLGVTERLVGAKALQRSIRPLGYTLGVIYCKHRIIFMCVCVRVHMYLYILYNIYIFIYITYIAGTMPPADASTTSTPWRCRCVCVCAGFREFRV
jgi:hypothetical protein